MKRLVMIQLLYVLGCLWTMSVPAGAFPSVTKIADTTVDSQGLTIDSYGWAINGLPYQQEAVLTCNGWQYMTFYSGQNSDGYVCVARRKLGSNGFGIGTAGDVVQSMFSLSWQVSQWSVIVLTDYYFTTNDAHNMISMGICPNDGTIHLSFDHHGDNLNYRVSQTGVATHPSTVTWDASLFGAVQDYLIPGSTITGVTYPRFWQTPSGDLQLSYRGGTSGDGDWWIADYTAGTGWSDVHQVIDSEGTYDDGTSSGSDRNPYLNGPIGYGPDGKLHATWTWREGSGTANHDIMYAYSEDGGDTWLNNSGVKIADSSTGQLITLDSTGVTVVTLSSYYGMMNQQGQFVDSQGRVHVLMYHCSPESYASGSYAYSRFGSIGARRYYHYCRNSQTGVWTRSELEFNTGQTSSWVGTRPKIYVRSNGDAYAVYQSWQDGDVNLTDTDIYIRYGDLVIQAATAANNWNDWQIIHVEPGPFVNEVLADPYHFEDGMLSIMMQDSPLTTYASTPIRLLDFQLND